MASASQFPKRLGDFEVLHELGRGGMGIVYEARQISLNRRVALKVLSSGLGLTSKAIMRFRREAEAAAKLHHTNIVPIYATGEEHGIHFYAMELVDGPSLDQVIRHIREKGDAKPTTEEGESTADHDSAKQLPEWVDETIALHGKRDVPSTPSVTRTQSALSSSASATGTKYFDTIATMMAGVADALGHAHEQGVIHRDIKPSNLLLGRDGRLSINDFGLARILEQPGMTMSGEFVGTPRYMSPEQITAGRAPLDHRTDIYSLGAAIYELLTLEPPFPGKSRDEVIAQILHKEPRMPRRLNRHIPTDLETICLKALDRDPDRRYQLACGMADDLRAYVNRFAISAKRTGTLLRAWKCIRRHPAVSASLLLVVLVSALAGWLSYKDQVNRRRIDEMAREQAQQQKDNDLRFAQELAMSAAVAGNFAKAKKYIPELQQLGATPGWLKLLNGQIALCQGDYELALRELKSAQGLLNDDLIALALLTRVYMDSGDEIAYYVYVAELRRRPAVTNEEHLFKGLALTWGYPAEALDELDKAYRDNSASLLVRLLRCNAICWNAMDTASLEDAESARKEAIILRTLMPDTALPISVHLLSTMIEANILRRSGSDNEAEELLKAVDVDDIDPDLLDQSDVRWARFQYFLRTAQPHRVKQEIERAPLNRSGVYLALWAAAELYRQEKLSEAINYYRIGAKLGRESQCKFFEALIQMEANEPARILADYLASLPSHDTSVYLCFDSYVLRLLGDSDAARLLGKRLAKMQRESGLDQKDVMLCDFIAGDCDATSLLAVTGKSRRFDCSAYLALGVDALADGRREDAAKYFRSGERTDYFSFYDHLLNRAFAERLESGEPWLEWIPDKSGTGTSSSRPVQKQE